MQPEGCKAKNKKVNCILVFFCSIQKDYSQVYARSYPAVSSLRLFYKTSEEKRKQTQRAVTNSQPCCRNKQVKPVDKKLPHNDYLLCFERGWDRGRERRTGRKAECNKIKQKLLL